VITLRGVVIVRVCIAALEALVATLILGFLLLLSLSGGMDF
jgi:hypothetical protein